MTIRRLPELTRGPRRLSAEERELWRSVTRLIVPIRLDAVIPHPLPAPAPEPVPDSAGDPAQADDAGRKGARAGSPTPAPRALKPPRTLGPPPPPPLAPLGRRLKGRVARGSEPIDARLDLHGLRQDEAHRALLGFLHAAQARRAKLVLVITGKGGRGAAAEGEGGGRGVLRALVPRWLALPEFRAHVLGFETAGTGHGGEGALYVRLRGAPWGSVTG